MFFFKQVGGREEFTVVEAIESGRIRKPVVAWCIGTCAQQLAQKGGSKGDTTNLEEVQFGHAGACARSEEETAVFKNARLAKAGVHVPESFNELGNVIRLENYLVFLNFPFQYRTVYNSLVQTGQLRPKPNYPARPVPMDYSWAKVHHY